MKIAVIGAGISGITAAYILSKKHDVTLYEQNNYLGGHTNTRVVRDAEGNEIPIDTGFIVCNPRNYPNFYQFLKQLNTPLRNSEMSFGYFCDEANIQYKGPGLSEFISEPRNFLQAKFLMMILDQLRFNRRVLNDLSNNQIREASLKQYLKELGVSQYFIKHYLSPVIASVWSSPDLDALEFPALTFATFFRNHGMLELRKRPQWQTVIGGSQQYVKAFANTFSGEILTNAQITTVSRNATSNSLVQVKTANTEVRDFDKVIFATHADEALKILEEPSEIEQKTLSSWRYSSNHTVLHSDESLMPPKRHLWASWNYYRRKKINPSGVSITYYMNRLQGLETTQHFFVTLNQTDLIDRSKIFYEKVYTHPIYTPDSVAASKELSLVNGTNNTYYCGAYFGYGFHEDGVRSALEVTKHFGLGL